MKKHRVFSYGTLVDKFPQEHMPVVLVGNYEISNYGMYPALIDSEEECHLQGNLLFLNDDELKEADYYEGHPGTYHRKEETIKTDEGLAQAWVYILKKEK